MERCLSEYLQLSPAQLSKIKNDPESTMLQLFVVSVITHGVNKGDNVRLNFLLEQMLGKIADKVNVMAVGHVVHSALPFSDMVKNPEILEDLIKIETKFRQLRDRK